MKTLSLKKGWRRVENLCINQETRRHTTATTTDLSGWLLRWADDTTRKSNFSYQVRCIHHCSWKVEHWIRCWLRSNGIWRGRKIRDGGKNPILETKLLWWLQKKSARLEGRKNRCPLVMPLMQKEIQRKHSRMKFRKSTLRMWNSWSISRKKPRGRRERRHLRYRGTILRGRLQGNKPCQEQWHRSILHQLQHEIHLKRLQGDMPTLISWQNKGMKSSHLVKSYMGDLFI